MLKTKQKENESMITLLWISDRMARTEITHTQHPE